MLAIVDYGIGNIRSVKNALDYLGVNNVISRDRNDLEKADALLLPGVGAFGEGIRRIDNMGIRPLLDDAYKSDKPILGICLGFELLMNASDELGDHEGLHYVDFNVRRLDVDGKLPHIGWSNVRTQNSSQSRLMAGLEGESFYFVHSYGVYGDFRDVKAASTRYCGLDILAVVECNNVFGTQFHPEKSGDAGLEMLRNFCGIL